MTDSTIGLMRSINFCENGSPNIACATMVSKNETGRTPCRAKLSVLGLNVVQPATYLCPIDCLARQNEVPRSDFFSQTAHCAECDDGLHSNAFESSDIGSRRDSRRVVLMIDAMPSDESNLLASRESEDGDGRRWSAPGLLGQSAAVSSGCRVSPHWRQLDREHTVSTSISRMRRRLSSL